MDLQRSIQMQKISSSQNIKDGVQGEIWKVISGFSNYAVSTWGRVKTIRTGLIKKQCTTRGHYVTRLTNDSGISQCPYVHRLMAIAFIPNPDNKPCINHIDGVKSNNSIENLEWCTWSENNQHAIDNGLRGYRRGHLHVFSIFSQQDIETIREMYDFGCTASDIKSLYNCSLAAIYNIVKRISYN